MKQSGVIKTKLSSAGTDTKLLLGIVLVGLLAVNATAGVFGIELGAQQTKLEADFSYGNKYTKTTINLKDVGLDNSSSAFKPTLFYQTGNHRFDFDYDKIGVSDSHKIEKEFRFGSWYYNVIGANVESKLDVSVFRLGYKYRFLQDNKSYLNLGADVNIVNTKIDIAAPTYGLIRNEVSHTQSLLGLVADGNYAFTNMFGIEGKLAGSFVYQEAYAGLNMELFKNAQLRVGYQYKKFELESDDNVNKKFDADLKYQGGFVGLNYRF